MIRMGTARIRRRLRIAPVLATLAIGAPLAWMWQTQPDMQEHRDRHGAACRQVIVEI